MPRSFSRITPWCLGWLLGTGLQLQQATLLPMACYGGLALAALCTLAWLLLRREQANEAHAVRSALGWALLALIMVAFGLS